MRRAMPKTQPLEIMDDKERKVGESNYREGAFAIPIDILEQKLLLQRGLIMISQGEYESAKDCFVKCINTGKQYDPRIRQECVS